MSDSPSKPKNGSGAYSPGRDADEPEQSVQEPARDAQEPEQNVQEPARDAQEPEQNVQERARDAPKPQRAADGHSETHAGTGRLAAGSLDALDHLNGHAVDGDKHADEDGLFEGEHDHFDPVILGSALTAARRGLKSEVEKLVAVLPEAEVYIPLSEDLPEAEEGERVEWEGELTFRPHMILGGDQSIFAVAYSDPQLVEYMANAMSWDTSGEELKLICVPAHVAFELSQLTLDGERVSGVVFNPGTASELVLQRDEAASLMQGQAIPLVGYVDDLPPDTEPEAQIVAGAEPPPPPLLAALEEAKNAITDVVDVRVETTFNPERDREPHLTIFLTIIARHDLDRQALADEVMKDAAPHLPPPGYADIVFLDAPN